MSSTVLCLITVVLFGGAGPSWAEFIQLNSGEVIEGKITSRSDDEIKIDTGIGIPITYYLDEVRQISDEPLDVVPQPPRQQRGSPKAPPKPADTSGHEPQHKAPPATETVPDAPVGILNIEPKSAPRPLPSPTTSMPLTVQSPPHQKPKKTNSDVQPRQEYLLMDKVQQEMKPGRKADTLTQESGSKEDYLKHQFEKQTQLYTEKIRGIIKEWDEKLTQAFKQYVQARRDRGQFPSGRSDTVWILGVLAGVYILYCLPFMLIARKLHFSGLMAWIPLLQLFLLTRVAGRPLLWLFLLLIPVINIFVLITLCTDIAKRLQRPSFLGFLLIVPGLNLFILWYFAFVRINPVFAPHALGEPIVRSGL